MRRRKGRYRPPTLDLHGVRHGDAGDLVEDFVLDHQKEVVIITGQSPRMREIVFEVLDRHGFEYGKTDPGAVRVYEDAY